MSENLKKKATRGFLWAFAERWATQIMQFVVAMVLARLLTPSDYGTVALLTIFITISETLVDSGLGRALVQKKNASDLDFNSVFYISLAVSLILYSVLFFCAPYIAGFYENESLTSLLRVQAAAIVIYGINGIQNAELNRKMLFNLSFRVSIIACLGTAVIGITMAFYGHGPWALVIGSIAGQIAGLIARWYFIAWRPKLMFSLKAARDLWCYGWKLAVSSLLDAAYNNLYGLLIGKMYTKADLAFVNRGRACPELAMGTFNGTLGRVAFPTLAKLQDDKEKMRLGAKRILTVSMFCVVPAMVGCAICAPVLIDLLFGNQWAEAVPYMRIACFVFCLWPFHTVNLQVLMAVGRSDLFLKLEIVKKFLGLLIICCFCKQGVFGMMAALAFICDPICAMVNAFPNRKIIGYSFLHQVLDVLPIFILSVVMGGVVLMIGWIDISPALLLFPQVCAGVLVYIGLSYLFRIKPFMEAVDIIKGLKR